MNLDSEVLEPWESISTFLSTAMPHPDIQDLSIHLFWSIPSTEESDHLADVGCESVLGDAEAPEAILENFFKHLRTLDLTIQHEWPSRLYNKRDHIRTHYSKSAVEAALRKKLPRITQKLSFIVSVFHLVRVPILPQPAEEVEASVSTIREGATAPQERDYFLEEL